MKFHFVFLLLTFVALSVSAQIKINSPYQKKEDKTYIPDAESADQTIPTPTGNTAAEEAAVGTIVKQLFNAMNQSDAAGIRALFAPEGRLLTTESNGTIKVLPVNEFSDMISKAPKGSLEERINHLEIRLDDHLATAWVEYDFYHNKNLSHCGVDAFQLHKGKDGWKIIQIADTRRKDCVAGGQGGVVGNLLDQWHASAARANAKSYFDLISPEGVYLGTDPGEHWTKDEFIKFAKPFFDKGNAWSFTARDRNVYFSDDGNISWFDELLDTWMGTCRGSGVLKRQADKSWKIVQYNLAILVPNDLVQEYLKLVESRN